MKRISNKTMLKLNKYIKIVENALFIIIIILGSPYMIMNLKDSLSFIILIFITSFLYLIATRVMKINKSKAILNSMRDALCIAMVVLGYLGLECNMIFKPFLVIVIVIFILIFILRIAISIYYYFIKKDNKEEELKVEQ